MKKSRQLQVFALSSRNLLVNFSQNSVKAWGILQAFLLLQVLTACHGSASWRMGQAESLIRDYNYSSSVLDSAPYQLFSAYPSTLKITERTLTVVIEGDGFAWVDRWSKSSDPTPLNPLGLKIAFGLDAVYLARPCQYISQPSCHTDVWTDGRFDGDVTESFNEALDVLKSRYGNREFRLVGYSGGAYIAMVLAAERQDIIHVDTVAGLLDPDDWTKFHNISPLEHSYGIQKLMEKTAGISFHHWCGREDKILPCVLHEEVLRGHSNHTLTVLESATHETVFIPHKE